MSSLVFQVFSQGHEKTQLGESPCWDSKTDAVWWVDVTGKRLLKTDTTTGKTLTWVTPEYPGFVVLTGSDAPAVGMQTGIYTFAPETGAFEKLVHFDQDGCRFNDATVDQHGRLWASTMALDAQVRSAAIHRISEDLGLDTFVKELSIPNGLAVDLERGKIYYSDSHPDIQKIWVSAFDADTGMPGETTLFARTDNLGGRPDGAALDQDGFYWIAGVDGSQLYVFDLVGRLHATIPVPFPEPTKVCFLGHENRSIVVTSKITGENGGFLAKASIPQNMPAGVSQPYWNPSA